VIENWIDAIAKLWEFDNGRGGTLKSYRVFERAEFPEALTEFPCAITYPSGLQPEYTVGGPTILLWDGVSEFHITPDVQMVNIPLAFPFYKRILTAAAGSMTLGGKVAYFIIPNEPGAVQFVTFEYDNGPKHRGLLLRWKVKENITGQITVAA